MTEGEPPAAEVAYTYSDVERYVDDVAAQRAELELAIVHARARVARAVPLEDRITALERRVSELMADWSQLGRSAVLSGGAEGPAPATRGLPQQGRRP